MSRAQEILTYIAGKRRRVGLDELVRNLDPGTTDRNRSGKLFSAQLFQLTKSGKLARHGKPCAYMYSRTATTLIDGRTHTADGKRRNKSALRAAARAKPKARSAPKPKPAAKPAAPRKVADTQRIAIARPPKPPRTPGQPETVAEFLARGGRIQRLKPGESSSPLYQSVRALNDQTMRQRLRAADNTPDYDLDDDDVAAIA